MDQYRDADGDGIPDSWEQQYFGSITHCAPEAAAFYARISLELGGRFYDEMERLIDDIRERRRS